MLELRLLVFLRSSSSYVLWLSACRGSTFHRFLSLGPLLSPGCILRGAGKEGRVNRSGLQSDFDGCSDVPPDALCPVGQEHFSACGHSSREKVCARAVLLFQRQLFPRAGNVAFFQFSIFSLKLCNFYKLNLMFLNEMLRERLFAIIFGCIGLFCLTKQNTKNR